MPDRNLPISDVWGAPSGGVQGGTAGGVQGGGVGYCPVGSVCDRGGGATDPDWYSKGIEASLADARAQMERGEITPTQYYQFELNTLGREAYMDKYGGEGGGGMPPKGVNPYKELNAEISDLKELKRQFPGAEATYMRWMIGNEIKGAQRRLQQVGGKPFPKSLYPTDPPMPGWMEEYLERSMPAAMPEYTAEQLAGRVAPPTPEGAYALRPLGAQAELTPEQMGLMAGYQAWGKAGSPREYSERALTEMADWQKSWQQHTRLSESLFPKQASLRSGWRTALQR